MSFPLKDYFDGINTGITLERQANRLSRAKEISKSSLMTLEKEDIILG